jgi:hypothetical protein
MIDLQNSRWPAALVVFLWAIAPAGAQSNRGFPVAPPEIVERQVGPYNVHALEGGSGLARPVPPGSHVLLPGGPATLTLWVRMDPDIPSSTLLASVGDPLAEDSLVLGLSHGRPMVRLSRESLIAAPTALEASGWHMLTAVADGHGTLLYVDGKEAARGNATAGRIAPQLVIAPADSEHSVLRQQGFTHFGGWVAGVTLLPQALSSTDIEKLAGTPPDFALLRWDEASPTWPVQTRGQAGYSSQQDPSLMPSSRAPLGKGVAKALPPLSSPALTPAGQDCWSVTGHWTLAAAPEIHAGAAAISAAGFNDRAWMRATVPGTVLTTMVDRGIYPDPDFGLNNLAIPESLARQDYWYRTEFETPRTSQSRFEIVFNGINYAAEVWLNGRRIGNVKGAFVRGTFDVTPALLPKGPNALAVRISPPPHPGIPQEQSLLGGPGENGGAMMLDGPTFGATEGWDWIPAIRDRNSGLWQDVQLKAHGALRIGDVQVVSRLPLPSTANADIEIVVPVNNTSSKAIDGTIRIRFEGVDFTVQQRLPPGQDEVKLAASEHPELHLVNPRLWWPNGYGRPDLYHMNISLAADGHASDQQQTTFGVREVTYELSLFDGAGHLRRVEVSPTEARALHEQVVDVRHEGLRRRMGDLWAASLTSAGEHSVAVRSIPNEAGLTDLVLKVNGVRIAARGGSWGMDDSRKRVSREHLEPYFRLHRDANLNIIRNWMGQDTEENFYRLADEYGLMVWNDFWESTQDDNVEAQDVPLFLNNARDTVRRFRNHPSIVMWCGRNEGVPQPVLNEGLIEVFNKEDGTRYYTPSSNRLNLRNSGPYSYREPSLYFDTLDQGFAVELGIASLATLESFRASIAEPDQWPISDAWAYHDWHWSGNGDVHPLMAAMDRQLGAATDLKDFERKAQMFNYVDHRAIFEGFNRHLWQPNSGRMLWMTQPAWPSNMWQIYNSDYDTNGSFYGVKKACEPLHVQLDLSDYTVAAVNTTNNGAGLMSVHAAVFSLANVLLLSQDASLDLGANRTVPVFSLALRPLFDREGVVLIVLDMKNGGGEQLSHNVYWLASDDTQYRKLNTLTPVKLVAAARSRLEGDEIVTELTLTNAGTVASLATKATLLHKNSGQRVLPAYFSDNYVTILPGETVNLTVRSAHSPDAENLAVSLRGWNVVEQTIDVQQQ